MGVVYEATISPSKIDFATTYFDGVPWGGAGEVRQVGVYRFDDPAGEVGVEGLLLSRGDRVLHLPLTYRDSPLPGADDHLITTAQHSVLGKRWVYDAAGDPVALACFARALRGEQGMAVLERHKLDGSVVPVVLPTRLRIDGQIDDAATDTPIVFTHDLADPVTGNTRLVVEWNDQSAVVAAR